MHRTMMNTVGEGDQEQSHLQHHQQQQPQQQQQQHHLLSDHPTYPSPQLQAHDLSGGNGTGSNPDGSNTNEHSAHTGNERGGGGSSSNNDNINNNEGGWNEMSAYHHPTMPQYGSFSYGSHATDSLPALPSESLQRMPPPPTPMQPMHSQPQHHSHAQLPMLTIPQQQPTWPSMLTHPSSYASHSAPPLSMPTMVAPSPKTGRPPGHQAQPRKTLTDEDRRKMCQCRVDNPNMKQTEIGAMFGVERSTVSKVLRHMEKYLSKEDRSQSPVKRTKGKLPDIDKAMTSWLRRQHRQGLELTDEELLRQARHFAMNAGNNHDIVLKTLTSTWVEKFRRKNGFGGQRLLRRASETNIPDHAKMADSPSLRQNILPRTSPSPLSADKSDDDGAQDLGFLSYPSGDSAYKHSNSQSTTSLNSAPADAAGSSFPNSAVSPTTAPFTFSPDMNMGTFVTNDQARQLQSGGESNYQRPRSQTFPTLELEYMQQQASTEPSTPRYPRSATATSSALDSPSQELAQTAFGIDNTMAQSPHLRRSGSNNSLTGRSGATSGVASGLSSTPVGSSPTSPTPEDARRAADTLLSFIKNAASPGFADSNEYSAVLRLTEKLKIHQHQMIKSGSMASIGGLSRIPEGDTEMLPPHEPNKTVEVTMAG